MSEEGLISLKEIQELIPHRYPFLLIDKVKNFRKMESCTGVKCVTVSDGFFRGHFPGNPVMPGVLIIEAMAQTSAVLVAKSLEIEPYSKSVLFTGIESAKFRKSVFPGDVLELNVKILGSKISVWFLEGIGIVDGKKVAETKFSALLIDK
ncbi:MAG: 3-hydroxyacyl-ACP dehydratase FabZ [Rickettsiales bacterium]|jgi:3-hydroxyacyl-[acyl-carrier-protein] dehydratase|nr:3-hydroxyacyl-ACP dehydratase FabZ [Rickettsiales bacterium]